MAKKQIKKHKFKHVLEGGSAVAGREELNRTSSSGSVGASVSRGAVHGFGTAGRDFSYVIGDVRRIGLLAGGLVAVELVLWLILAKTPIGEAIYRLF